MFKCVIHRSIPLVVFVLLFLVDVSSGRQDDGEPPRLHDPGDTLSVDLENVSASSDHVDSFSWPYGDGLQTMVAPLHSSRIGFLTDGARKIFDCREYPSGLAVWVLLNRKGRDCVLKVLTDSGSLFFSKVGDSYARVTPREYTYLLHQLEIPCALDLNVENSTALFTVSVREGDGVEQVIYQGTPGHRIDSVFCDGVTIWSSGGDGSYCYAALLYRLADRSALQLFVEGRDRSLELHYSGLEGHFSAVSADVFEFLLSSIDFGLEVR